MIKFFKHLWTIHRHRCEVRKLCFKCGLYWQGFTHDLSKYSPVEFINGVKFFTGASSPHLGEREKYGYSKAWLHHKGYNKHHAEYWQDIKSDGTTGPVDMPTKYFIEMICDRVAASKIYLKDKYTNSAPWEYYINHKCENQFSNETRCELERVLKYLKVYGEDATFEWLKAYLKESTKRNRKY